jgi:polysaccharide biosynthesis/export protein
VQLKNLWLIFVSAFIFSSCQMLNPERMLRTPDNYEFAKFPDTGVQQEYILAPNDQLSFRLFTNEGEKLIDPISPTMQLQQRGEQSYEIEFDGLVKLPVLGRVKLSGMTLREAEHLLESQYKIYYNRPFVKLQVINHRVTVFPGGRGGTSTVVYLQNTNTNLFEALAMAGGISDGRAQRVKLIRGELTNPQVFLIDLSTIEGVRNANMILQANDIIYVEPRERVPQRILENVTPYLSLLTAAVLVYSLFK